MFSARQLLIRSHQTTTRCAVTAQRRNFLASASSLDAVPRASNPIAFRPISEHHRKPRTTFRSRRGSPKEAVLEPRRHKPREHAVVKEAATTFPTTNWIHIRDCPPLASLDDIVNSVNHVLDIELKIGILDIDASRSTDGGSASMVEPTLPWIKSAHVVLSTHGRPTNWKIELENRSIVHAFLEHAKETEFMCVWKASLVAEWDPAYAAVSKLEVTESMVRIENGPERMTKDHLRHLFRRYDLTTQGNTISSWHVDTNRRMFLVRFADPANARAAVREMQSIEVQGSKLKLSQYPKQIFRNDKVE